MTDWFLTSSQAIRTQPQMAQTLAAIVNERMLLPTMIMIWGMPEHPCHPKVSESGFIAGVKGFCHIGYTVCRILVKGSCVVTNCEHPDHLSPHYEDEEIDQV